MSLPGCVAALTFPQNHWVILLSFIRCGLFISIIWACFVRGSQPPTTLPLSLSWNHSDLWLGGYINRIDLNWPASCIWFVLCCKFEPRLKNNIPVQSPPPLPSPLHPHCLVLSAVMPCRRTSEFHKLHKWFFFSLRYNNHPAAAASSRFPFHVAGWEWTWWKDWNCSVQFSEECSSLIGQALIPQPTPA